MSNKEFFIDVMIEEGLESFSQQYDKEILELNALIEVMKEKGKPAKKIESAQKEIIKFEKTKQEILSEEIKKEIKEFAEKEVSILSDEEIDKAVENYKFSQKINTINDRIANKFLSVLDRIFDEEKGE